MSRGAARLRSAVRNVSLRSVIKTDTDVETFNQLVAVIDAAEASRVLQSLRGSAAQLLGEVQGGDSL